MRELPGVLRKQINMPGSPNTSFSLSEKPSDRVPTDMQKLYKLSRGIQLMIQSKKLVDCVLVMIIALKQAYPQVSASTVYILDSQLQHFIENDMENQLRHCRQLPCPGFTNGNIIAIFDKQEDFCSPVFKTSDTAGDSIFNSRVIYLPILSQQQKLLFAFQVELNPDYGKAVV